MVRGHIFLCIFGKFLCKHKKWWPHHKNSIKLLTFFCGTNFVKCRDTLLTISYSMETQVKNFMQWAVTCLPTRMLQKLSSTSNRSLHRINLDNANHIVGDTGTTQDDRNKANEKMNECRNAQQHPVLCRDKHQYGPLGNGWSSDGGVGT